MFRQGNVIGKESAHRYVRQFAESSHTDAAALADTGTERPLDLITVIRDEAHCDGWLAYWIHPQARGRGLMTHAALTMASSELSEGDLERLELGHRANNPASGAVARRAEFVHEGTQRALLIAGERHDVLIYGRLADDPTPSTKPLSWANETRPWRCGRAPFSPPERRTIGFSGRPKPNRNLGRQVGAFVIPYRDRRPETD